MKDVLEKGVEILPLDYYEVHGKKQQTGICAAPITIGGERYICVVEVIRNKDNNRLYTHEVTLQEKLLDVRAIPSQTNNVIPATNQGAFAKVLQNVVNAKDYTKVLDANGEPMVVCHGTPNQFNTFNRELIGSSTDRGIWGRGFYFSCRYRKRYPA